MINSNEFIGWITDACQLNRADARKKAASLLGVSPETIRQWEDGKSSPDQTVLLLMDSIRQANRLELPARARRFAEQAHEGQYRKVSRAPYFTHVCQVGHYVSERTDAPELIAAAYLHDTIEDTGTSYFRLAELFGRQVANLVYTLTNDKSVEKKDKAGYLAAKMAAMHPDALLIKLCDILANVSDAPSPAQLKRYRTIVETVTDTIPANPPAVWTPDHECLAGRILDVISFVEKKHTDSENIS